MSSLPHFRRRLWYQATSQIGITRVAYHMSFSKPITATHSHSVGWLSATIYQPRSTAGASLLFFSYN